MNETDLAVDNFVDGGARLLVYVVTRSDHPAHEAWSTRMAGGQPFQLMLCRRAGRVHAYSIGTDGETQEAFAALVQAVHREGLDSRQWLTTEYGPRYHIEFEVPA